MCRRGQAECLGRLPPGKPFAEQPRSRGDRLMPSSSKDAFFQSSTPESTSWFLTVDILLYASGKSMSTGVTSDFPQSTEHIGVAFTVDATVENGNHDR